MRIITGSARGVRLETLEGETTRPTPERVKEAVFSAIQFDLVGKRFLDLFAGSGQMGLEAVSRGAALAVLVDEDAGAVQIIKNNAKKAKLFEKCRVSNISYTAFLRGAAGKETFDYIYLDPPFAAHLWADALKRIRDAKICHADSVIICESESEELFSGRQDVQQAYTVIKQVRYGRIVSTWLKPCGEKEEKEEMA